MRLGLELQSDLGRVDLDSALFDQLLDTRLAFCSAQLPHVMRRPSPALSHRLSLGDREEEPRVAGSKAVGLPISDGALVVFLVPPGLKHLVEDCAHDNTDQRVASWSSHWSQIDRHYLLALGFG